MSRQSGGRRLGVASLNRKHLEVRKGRNYANVMFIGDVHYGSSNCDVERFTSMIDYCVKNGIYVFLMGDMLEAATRYSVGSGVYMQLNPQQQYDDMLEMLRPLAEKGLILDFVTGNHEDRITKETGIDISKMMCRELKCHYAGAAGWTLLYVGDQSYSVYAIHGAGGSKFNYTKLKNATDISHYFDADIIAYAHLHSIISDSIERQTVNRTRKMVETRKSHILITGHYLMYDKSYAQAKGLPPSKLGSPKVQFHADKWDIHISI